ncbi:hypothetical protein HY095_01810 [Candidatus Micrarchaeota archaeon]|nr:hypothetical protein [Candidatus Micrarchaeota archaeon]
MLFARKALLLPLMFLLLSAGFASALANGSASANASGSAALNASANATAGAPPTGGNATVNATPAKPALTGVDAEIGYYLNSGETPEKVPVTAGGRKYTLVKVGGSEAIVFDENENALTTLSDINAAVPAYVSQLDIPFKQANLDAIKTNYASLKSSTDYCSQVYYNFTQGNRGSFCFILAAGRAWLCSLIYSTDLSSILNLSVAIGPAKAAINSGFASMNGSLRNINSRVADLDGEFQQASVGGLTPILSDIKSNITSFKAGYDQFNSAHSSMLTQYEFAHDGGLGRCNIDVNAMGNIDSQASAGSSFPNAQAIGNAILSFTAGRTLPASIRKATALREGKVAALEANYARLSSSFKKANRNMDLPGLGKKVADARAKLGAIGNQTNASIVATAAADADKAITDASLAYESQNAVLADYSASLSAINNASATLATATKKFGTNDPRVAEMRKQVTQLRESFQLSEQDLKSARPVTAEQFKNAGQNATALSTRLVSLRGRENEIDLTLIAGVILILAALAGGFTLLRKLKANRDAARTKANTEVPIEKLQDGRK